MEHVTRVFLASMAGSVVLAIALASPWVQARPPIITLCALLLIGASLFMLETFCVILAVGRLP